MLAVILSGVPEEEGKEVWSKLSPDDAEAVGAVMDRVDRGRSKKSKRKKSKKLQNSTDASEDQ